MSPRNEFMRYFASAYQGDMQLDRRRTTDRPQAVGRLSEFPQNESTGYQDPRKLAASFAAPAVDRVAADHDGQ